MGKPPERLDDVAMPHGVAQLLRIVEHLIQAHAAVLIGERLGMHEWQIEERPHHWIGRLIVTARQCAIGHGAGHRIGRKGARFSAKHVARKLVEQKHKRERALARLLPVRTLAGRRGLVHREKSRADGAVKSIVQREPLVRPGFEPERYDVGRRYGSSHAQSVMPSGPGPGNASPRLSSSADGLACNMWRAIGPAAVFTWSK